MNNIKKNLVYNIIYQIMILIIPLIMAPYLSRTIAAKGVGIYSYTYSIVYYFMLICLLGVNNYGNRSIAKVRDDKKELSKTFWSIYFLQLIMGILMLIIYFIYVFISNSEYKYIAIIQALYIVSSILDINWFYFGLEEFKVTITRNSIVKIGTIVLIFIFVKSYNDLWKYVLIMSGTTVFSQLILWFLLKKKVSFIKVKYKDIVKHLKPNLVLFIPVIAISLYKIMDKIMLGKISDVTEVGFYENAEKITQVPMALISALGTVMLPRMSNIIAKGENDKVKNYISKSLSFIQFLSFAMCFGLIAIGYNFAPIFFGKEFQKSGILIMLLAITIPFLAFANVIRTQYLIPKEKDRIYIKSVIYGAIINLIMNFIFIPKYKSIGACFGTIAAEIMVMFYQSFSISNEIEILDYIKKSMPFLLKAVFMFIIVYPLNLLKMSEMKRLVLQIALGACIYMLLNIKYINSIVNIKRKLFKIEE